MSLVNTIKDDLKTAMKAKNELDLAVLRMLLTGIKNKMISLGEGGKNELDDSQALEVVSSEVKKRKDSIEAYVQGNRQDLADREAAEIKILEKYMPAQLSEEEIEKVVKEIVSSGNFTKAQFGQVMGQAMGKLKGQADGNAVSLAVKKVLGE